jgi:hypothetical protein
MLISSLLFLACNRDVAPETTTTTTTTTDEGCSSDAECSSGNICEVDECVEGDRNNSPEEAETLLWDESASDVLNPAGDVDYYNFSAHGGEYIRVTTETEFEDADTVLVLRDPTGQILTWSDDFPTGTAVTSLDSVIYAYLPYEGEYLLAVEDYFAFNNPDDAYGHPSYDYSISLTDWDQFTAEPDSQGDASLTVDMDAVNLWDSVGVHIQDTEDIDWIELNYSPEGEEGISPFLYISGIIHLDGSSLSPQVRLRDQDGNVLSDFVGVGPEGVLLYPNMVEGQYWIEVKDADDRGGDAYWTFLFLISRDYTPYPMESESNDSIETANPVEFVILETDGGNEYKVGKAFGELGIEDTDVFSFSHDYPEGQIVLCLNSSKYGSTTSPFIQITDTDGNIVAEGTADTGEDPNFSFQEDISETGEYFISITDDEAIGLDSDWYQFLLYSTDFEATSYSCP